MSLFSALSVSASGMAAQRARAELLAENLANAETTRTPEGGPYRRKDAVFAIAIRSISPSQRCFESQVNRTSSGVRVAQVSSISAIRKSAIMPGHPDADKDGYVAFPRMNPAEDMVDLLSASRGYQANVAAMSRRERHDPAFDRSLQIDLVK